jgi:hypothetical protein
MGQGDPGGQHQAGLIGKLQPHITRRNPASEPSSGRGYCLTRRSFPSNGRAIEVGRRGPTAINDRRRLPRRRIPSAPSRPTCGPSRRLLVLLPQQQLDALSDHASNRSGRIWNFSEDLKAQIRAPVAPEILDENDTPGRPKESCTSEPGYRDGTQNDEGPLTSRTAPKPPINNTADWSHCIQPSMARARGHGFMGTRRANDTKAARRHLPPGSGDLGPHEEGGPLHEVREHLVIHPRRDRAAAEAGGRAAVGMGPTSDTVVRAPRKVFVANCRDPRHLHSMRSTRPKRDAPSLPGHTRFASIWKINSNTRHLSRWRYKRPVTL